MKTALTRAVLAIMLLAMVSLVNNASAHASGPWDTPQVASSAGTSGGVNVPAAQITGANLIVNGDAESSGPSSSDGNRVVAAPGWTGTGTFTLFQYGASGGPDQSSPGPKDRGNNCFFGGVGAQSSAQQTINVTGSAAAIDAGNVKYDFQGWLGGYASQDDNATVTAEFIDGSGKSLGKATLGPVLAAERKNVTGLILKSTNGSVPAGTRTITVVMLFVRTAGSANDGTVDNLSLVLTSGTGQGGGFTPIPQPNTNVTNMTIQAAQRQVITGELVDVRVWIIKANNVANINYQITYDAKVAKPEGALTKGNLLENALFSVNANQSGSVLSGFAQTTGLAGTGTVLNIPFRAVGKPGDRTPLDVTVTAINDPNGGVLKIDRIPGEILIYSKDGTFPQPPTTGGQPIPPPPPAIPRGDCDGDGKVTEVDALCSLEISVNLRPSTPLSDVDNSGDVTSRDAVILLKLAINKP